MEIEFRLPHLGENITSAEIVKINVAEGDKVEVDQVVVEIETDKATVEIPSDVSGIVKKIYLKEGTKAKVGEPIISIEVSSQSPVVNSEKQKEKNEERRTKEKS